MNRLVLSVSLIISIVGSVAFSQTLSVEDVIKDASPAVVKIVVYDITGTRRGQGSGFFIARGKIVTNAHVVEAAYSAEVHSFLKTYEHVTITKRDDDIDLALLAVQDVGEPIIALAHDTDLQPGQRVLAIGNPLGLDRTVSDGLISAVRGIPGQLQLIQISAPISPGSSGGPLLNMQGSAIGVTSASMTEGQNVNFAIGIETLNQFLQLPDNPEPLKKARTRVLWRTILKWVLNIVLGIVALAFGGGWWIIGIVIMALIILFYILGGLWKLITAPFGRKGKVESLFGDGDQYQKSPEDMHTRQASLFAEQDEEYDDETYEGNFFHFHCWKCGQLVEVDKSAGDNTVECEECGTKLEIPFTTEELKPAISNCRDQLLKENQIAESKSISSKELSAVLIVEDDTQVAKMLKDFFSSEGFKSYIAFDGVEAIGVLKNNHIDVVMTDVMMPRINGLDLTKVIKREYDSDVIIFTGYEKNCNYQQAMSLGASDFFYKPFKFKDMLDSVKRIIEKRLPKSLGS